MKTNKLKKIQFIFFTLIFLTLCCGFDDGCEPTQAPPPPTIQISSESSNNQTKFYFKPDEKVVIEKIEVKNAGQLVENIIFGYPFLVCNANEKHIINSYTNVQYGYEFYFSGVSRTTGYQFTSLPGVVYY